MVKTDTIVSGVHFLADEKPELVAAKALRVCLSDLAAGGATPFTYQLSLSLSKGWTERWVAAFARGLAADQRRYGIVLCGGDTVVTPGPLTDHHHGLRPRRARPGAQPGRRAGGRRVVGERHDRRWRARPAGRARTSRAQLLENAFRQPQPRTTLGPRLVGIAHATADVSDGLLADAGHIADASRLAVHDRARMRAAVGGSAPRARREPAFGPTCWAAATTTNS